MKSKLRVGNKLIQYNDFPYVEIHYTVMLITGNKVVLRRLFNDHYSFITTDFNSKLMQTLHLDIQTQFNNDLEELIKC